jgi:hypothetical protein
LVYNKICLSDHNTKTIEKRERFWKKRIKILGPIASKKIITRAVSESAKNNKTDIKKLN